MELLIGEVTPEVLEQLGEYSSALKGDKVVTREEIKEIISGVAEQAQIYKELGFDCCELHMSYCGFITSLAMSPVINTRKDEYGGTFENRFRMAMEMLQAIRDACGPDFIIIVHISGEEPEENGYKLHDVIRFAKMAEGLIDILQIRMGDNISAHPTGFNSTKERPVTLDMAAEVKAQGVNMLVAAVGGFQDPDIIEAALESGKIDLVAHGPHLLQQLGQLLQVFAGGARRRRDPMHTMPKMHRGFSAAYKNQSLLCQSENGNSGGTKSRNDQGAGKG